jgi:hypothetical protein
MFLNRGGFRDSWQICSFCSSLAGESATARALLKGRTKGSIERKHQNISAVLIEAGYPYVDGYKPLRNYQALLREIVLDRLSMALELQRATAGAVERPVERAPWVTDILSVLVPPPEHWERDVGSKDRLVHSSKGVGKDYLEIESRNRSLGVAGEMLVLEYEHARLWKAGKKDLADRIEHVSATRWDGWIMLSLAWKAKIFWSNLDRSNRHRGSGQCRSNRGARCHLGWCLAGIHTRLLLH